LPRPRGVRMASKMRASTCALLLA